MNKYIAVHFETCGLPSEASPIVLDALLFDWDGKMLDRFCVVMKPNDHARWDSSADSVHGITKEIAFHYGYTYPEVVKMFNTWVNSMDHDVTLVAYDLDTTLTLSTMVKGTVDVFHFLGNKKLPIQKAIDLQRIMVFYMHRTKTVAAKDIQYRSPVTQVVQSWGLVVDSSAWTFVQNQATFRSRAMAYMIHLVFMTLFNAKGN